MKTLFTFLISIISLSMIAQEEGRKYYFKEIGWSIVLPSDFQIVDNKTAKETSLKGSKSDPSGLKILVSAGKSSGEMFQAAIARYNARENDFKKIIQKVKDSNYVTFLKTIPGAKLDSNSSVKTIDGVLFDRFEIKIRINGKIINYFLLSKLYKRANLGITYVYATDLTKQELETMLNESKFDKWEN